MCHVIRNPGFKFRIIVIILRNRTSLLLMSSANRIFRWKQSSTLQNNIIIYHFVL